MKNYKISVVIPTYNRAWCIADVVQSVISQSYQNRELIVIDDGSTDNTQEVLQPLLSDKIKYFYKENSGKLDSVNYAIDNFVDGDLLFVLDSDDAFQPGIMEDANKELNQNPDLVSIHYKAKIPEHISNRKSQLKSDRQDIIVGYEELVAGKTHNGDFPGFINLHKLGDIRFEQKCPNGLETIFWYRLAKLGKSKYINKDFIIMDAFRKKGENSDNLTSYSWIFKRAPSMMSGYEILINENYDDVFQIDKNILNIRYKEFFQWCIVDRQLKKGFEIWINGLKYGSLGNRIKMFGFGILLIIPKRFLPMILKIYYLQK